MVTLISAALKKGKLDTDMLVCSIRENKKKILVIIVRYLKRTGKRLTPCLRAIQTQHL
jgi:transcription termination factor NusB